MADQKITDLTALTSPDDADVLPVVDVAPSATTKKITWANIKTALSSIFFVLASNDADDIDDSASTNKFTTAGDISKLAGIESSADVTDAGNVGSSIDGATAKTTPVDADTMPLIDSAAGNALKKITWANIKTALNGALSFLANIVEDTTPQLGGDLDLNGKAIDFPSTANIADCLDEDAMGSNSATALATQQSIKAYADTHVVPRSIMRVYTAGDTWNKPSVAEFSGIKVWVVAGGGGGGGAGTNTTIGGGGGGAAAAYKEIAAASLGSSETVTVGAAGSGGAAGNNAGSAGGTSSFGAHASCTGGGGGDAGSGSSGGAGGTASGGDVNGDGIGGEAAGTSTDTYRGYGGSPGIDQGLGANVQDAISRLLSPGGVLGQWAGASVARPPSWDSGNDYNGFSGTKYGSGGSGGMRGTGNVSGGDGQPGVVVVIEEYE